MHKYTLSSIEGKSMPQIQIAHTKYINKLQRAII